MQTAERKTSINNNGEICLTTVKLLSELIVQSTVFLTREIPPLLLYRITISIISN